MNIHITCIEYTQNVYTLLPFNSNTFLPYEHVVPISDDGIGGNSNFRNIK